MSEENPSNLANNSVLIALLGEISNSLYNINIELKNIREVMEK